MRPITRVVMLSIAAVMAVALLSPVAVPAGQRCSSCHAGSNPAGGYVFRIPSLETDFPGVVPPNTSFCISLKLGHPGNYIIRELAANISVQGDGQLPPATEASRSLPTISSSGGTASVNWTITAGNATGTLRVSTTLRFTAHHRHTNDHDSDDGSYVLARYWSITVKPVAVYATETDLTLTAAEGGSAGFELVCCSTARNITLAASPNLASVVSFIPRTPKSLEPGQRMGVSVNVVNGSRPVDNGRIDIVWENETGARDSSFVTVSIAQSPPGPVVSAGSTLIFTGRATGLLSFGLLAASVVLGLVKKGGSRLVRVHCAVSWFILGLSVYHGLMLVWGPFSTIWLGNWVIVGYVSAAVMGASSVNGLAQKWISKKAGYKAWIWMHRGMVIAAIVLVLIHAVLMGTDFVAIRSMFQPDAGA